MKHSKVEYKPIILFDLDGTLIDSTEAILESFHYACSSHESILPEDQAIKALIGHPLDVMFARLGVVTGDVWAHVDTYKAYYREISRQKTFLLDFTHETLAHASRFARLGIVTTKTGRYSQELLEHFGVMHYFETLVGREHVQHPKPHAQPALLALQNMQGDARHAWLIGDTHMDVLCAKNASIHHVAVTSGYETHAQLSLHTQDIFPNALLAVKHIHTLY